MLLITAVIVYIVSVRCWQSEGVPVEEGMEKTHVGLTASSPLYPSGIQHSEDSRLGSLYSDTSFASSFNPDNVSIERHPVISG